MFAVYWGMGCHHCSSLLFAFIFRYFIRHLHYSLYHCILPEWQTSCIVTCSMDVSVPAAKPQRYVAFHKASNKTLSCADDADVSLTDIWHLFAACPRKWGVSPHPLISTTRCSIWKEQLFSAREISHGPRRHRLDHRCPSFELRQMHCRSYREQSIANIGRSRAWFSPSISWHLRRFCHWRLTLLPSHVLVPNPEVAYLQACCLNIGDREAQVTDFSSSGRYSAGRRLPFIVVPQMSGWAVNGTVYGGWGWFSLFVVVHKGIAGNA